MRVAAAVEFDQASVVKSGQRGRAKRAVSHPLTFKPLAPAANRQRQSTETNSLPNRRRRAARVRSMADTSGAHDPALTIRELPDGTAPELQRLAELDSAEPPTGPVLAAEADGKLVAEVPLDGGRPIADPFRRTADIVRVLEFMAKLRGRGRR
jgi:hypothetical protein